MKHSPVSKINLSKLSGLKPPTVANIITDLERDRLIIYCGKGPSGNHGGALPDLYCVNSNGGYFIGLDIGNAGITGVLIDAGLEVVKSSFMKTAYLSVEQLKLDIDAVVNDLKSSGMRMRTPLLGIGVSVAGLVDAATGVVTGSKISILNAYPLRQMLERRYMSNVWLDNDINCILAMKTDSLLSSRSHSSILCLGIREYIGFSMVFNGSLYRGAHTLGGNMSDVSSMSGTNSMVKYLAAYAVENPGFCSDELGAASPEDIDETHMLAAVTAGNEKVIDVLRPCMRELGECAGKLIEILDPDVFYVCSPLFDSCDELFCELSRACRALCGSPYDVVRLEKIAIKREDLAVSAASMCLNEFLDNVIKE